MNIIDKIEYKFIFIESNDEEVIYPASLIELSFKNAKTNRQTTTVEFAGQRPSLVWLRDQINEIIKFLDEKENSFIKNPATTPNVGDM